MNKSIYVGNLPFTSSQEDVRALFAPYGNVANVKMIMDRETGRPRGFGFVEMSAQDAENAIKALDGKDYGGRSLRVNLAQERQGGGGGGGPRSGGGRPPRNNSW